MSTQYLGDKPNEGAIRSVTSLNGENGEIIVNQQTLGFDKEIIKKSDVGHEHNYADSDTAGGSATSAHKITTDAGSDVQPVYFNNGVPYEIQYEIKASVPSDAEFTDTTYSAYENGNAGLIKLYDSFGDNTDGAMTQEAINNVSSTMAGQSVSVNETLLASNWSGTSIPYKYELELDGVTESSNQEIMPADDITDEQLYYMQGANLQDGGQSIGKIILNAFAVKPPIDIPIKIIMRKD